MTDVEYIKRMAKSMGVKDENVFHNHDVSKKDVFETEKQVRDICKMIDNEKRRCVLIVYCGGHGVECQGKQVFLLNSSTKEDALFNIEKKLRTFANLSSSLQNTNIFALYDCCRSEITAFPGLVE